MTIFFFLMKKEEISNSQKKERESGAERQEGKMGEVEKRNKKEGRKGSLFCWISFNRFYFKYQISI